VKPVARSLGPYKIPCHSALSHVQLIQMSRNSVVLVLLGLLSALAGAQTSYIRQFARDKPKVAFIAVGPESKMQAHRLRDQVLDNFENVHKRNEVTVVMADQVKDWNSRLGPNEHASYIFVATEKELKQPLPPDVAAMLPAGAKPMSGQVSFVQSQMTKPAKQGLSFSIVLYAPDGKRLEWLCDAFANRTFNNWRDMPYANEFVSDRIAMFSQGHMKDVSTWWGKTNEWNIWRDISWYSIDRRDLVLPEDLEHTTEVYLVDRSKDGRIAPEAAGELKELAETSLYVSNTVGEDGRRKLVFSAPSRLLLHNLAVRFPNLHKLPQESYRVEAVDLRTLDKALLVVPAGAVDGHLAKQIHSRLLGPFERGTGQPLHPPLREGAPNEVPLPLLVGKSEEAIAFRNSLNLRYAWVYVVNAPETSMNYNAFETRHTSDPGPFTESEPCEPSRDKKTKEEYEAAMKKYREEHEEWCNRKRQWEYDRDNMQVTWTRTLQRNTTVTTGGHLRLLDLANGGKTVWETQVSGSASEYSKEIESDTVYVRGFSHVPDRLDAPTRNDPPPAELIVEASVSAASWGLHRLQAEAWLPEFRTAEPEKR
jgi:hypothetical protein